MLSSNFSIARGLPANPKLQARAIPADGSNPPRPRPYLRYREQRSGARLGSSPSSHSAVSRVFDVSDRGDLGISPVASMEDNAGPPSSHLDQIPRPPQQPSGNSALIPQVHSEEDGENYAAWFRSRVTNAAKTLTINASKAWTVHIATSAGEETPPGHDSRLTRAMKAYHLAKARDSTDLPVWLFGELDRRQPITRSGESHQDTNLARRRELQEPQRLTSGHGSPGHVLSVPAFGARGTPKASERLRAMGDAKRSAPRNTRLRDYGGGFSVESPRVEVERVRVTRQPRPIPSRQLIGLPSGPRRK